MEWPILSTPNGELVDPGSALQEGKGRNQSSAAPPHREVTWYRPLFRDPSVSSGPSVLVASDRSVRSDARSPYNSIIVASFAPSSRARSPVRSVLGS